MSRVGKTPINLPAGVNVTVNGSQLTVENSGKKLEITLRPEVSVEVDSDAKLVKVGRCDDSRTAKAMHGLTRALVQNMIIGLTKGYSKELEIHGVGWTGTLKGTTVELKVGYADIKKVEVPAGVTVEIKGNKIKVSGTDKQLVGQTAASIREQRKPEPYNGKGIKYSDEVIIRKQGKAFAG